MKIISRIKGGLGNQLYCYSVAKRLAIANGAELVIDDVSGFERDHQFQRKYMLDYFNISSRKATKIERLEPFERVRRGIRKKIERLKIFENRNYIEQEFDDFDSRILELNIYKDTYIDGLWQSEKYFKDIKQEIKNDLKMEAPKDKKNLSIAKKIKSCNSVAIHIRLFDQSTTNSEANVKLNYYQIALDKMESTAEEPFYFIFSDNPKKAKNMINLPLDRTEFMTHNSSEESAIWDFWLMKQCSNFIIANSTFSWWAAWLSNNEEKSVFFPRLKENKSQWCWDYDGQMPLEWQAIEI